jgi:deoxyribonuclease-4
MSVRRVTAGSRGGADTPPVYSAHMRIGAHVGRDEDPLGAAKERGADCVQLFLSDPQGWKIPATHPHAEALAAADIPVYVHAPYIVNVASTNNRIRIPSRQLLQKACTAAGKLGAAGVIVHGGHITASDGEDAGFDNWRKAIERLDSPVPVFLENTAGGDHAMARHFDTLARLWEHVGDLDLGFCLDTCHAHAAGEDLAGVVERAKAITGRIDLVHANDSKDPAGSGRDRHQNLGDGEIGLDPIAAICAAAGVDVICETPGGAAGQGGDIERLRERLGA